MSQLLLMVQLAVGASVLHVCTLESGRNLGESALHCGSAVNSGITQN